MYSDSRPCAVCGAQVRLEPRSAAAEADEDERVGPPDGIVGGADPTVDQLTCTNPECPTNRAGAAGDVKP